MKPTQIIALLLGAGGALASGQTVATWNGGTGTWNAASANWTVSGSAAAWPAAGLAVFPTTGSYRAVTLDNGGSALAVAGLRFDDGGYTLAPNAPNDSFSLGASGIVANPGTGNNTIANALTLTANSSVTNHSGNSLFLNGNIALGSNALTLAGSSWTTVGGTLSGSGAVTVTGRAQFSMSPTHTGATTVSDGGTLWVDGGVSLASTNLVASGGATLVVAGATFSPSLGSGAGQLRVASGDMGFSAYQTALTVNIGGAAATLTPGTTTHFLASGATLTLGSAYAQAATTFANPLSLPAGTTLYATVPDNPASTADYAYLSGGIQGNGSLVTTGLLSINAAASTTFSGIVLPMSGTVVFSGGALPGNSTAYAFGGGEVRGYGTLPLATAAYDSAKVAYIGAAGGALSVGSSGHTLTWTQSGGAGGPSAFAFANYDAGSSLTFLSNLNLSGNLRTVSVSPGQAAGASDIVKISGTVTNGTLVKTGGGTLLITNTGNSFGGATGYAAGYINGGALAFTKDVSGNLTLPVGSGKSYVFNGGVLQYDHNGNNGTSFDLTFRSGTENGGAASSLIWQGDGGFAARGAQWNLTLGGISNGVPFSTPVWGSTPNFLRNGDRLRLGSSTADNVIKIVSPLDLGGGQRTIDVTDNTAVTTDSATLAGAITNGGVTKAGAGLLWLASTNNTYAGDTRLEGGVTRFGVDTGYTYYPFAPSTSYPTYYYSAGQTLPSTSNLTFAGGVFEQAKGTYTSGYQNTYNNTSSYTTANQNFTRTPGTGAGQVQWTGDGGFSAYNGNLTVNLGNDSRTLTWGQGSFVPDGSRLLFGSIYADSAVTFQNPINLNAAVRTIDVGDNPNTTADVAYLTGAITNGGLVKTGAGTLNINNFSGTNTYSLGTTISGGKLVAGSGSGSGSLGTGAITMASGTTLEFGGGTMANSVALGSGTETIAGSGTLNGIISGSGALNLGSGSTLVLNGANTYTGGTIIGTGTVIINSATQLGTGSVTLNGGTLRLDSTATTFTRDLTLGASGGSISSLNSAGVTFSGSIGGSGNLTLGNYARLTGTNTYTGSTTIAGSKVYLGTGALPASSHVRLQSGSVQLDSGSAFTATLGTGASQWELLGGGFGTTSGGSATVTLNGGAALTWGSTSGFMAGTSSLSYNADGRVTYANPIDLGGTTRNVIPNSGIIELSGALSNGSLFTTNGEVRLTGTNTLTGQITTSGQLSFTPSAIATANVLVSGGWITPPANAPVSLTLGTGAGQVRFASGTAGGFGYYSDTGIFTAASTFELNGGATITWGTTTGFLSSGSTLRLDRATLANPLNFNGTTQSVSVWGQTGALSGSLSNGTLNKVDNGTLTLSGTNSLFGITVSRGGLAAGADANLGASGATVSLAADAVYNSVYAGSYWNGYTYVAQYNNVLAGYTPTALTLTGAGTYNKAIGAGGITTVAATATSGTTRVTGNVTHGGGAYTQFNVSAAGTGELHFDNVNLAAPLNILSGQVRLGGGTVSGVTTVTGTLNSAATHSGAVTVTGTFNAIAGYPSGGVTLNGGTLRHTNGMGFTTAALPAITGSGTFDSSGFGPLAFTSTGLLNFTNSGAHSLTLTGTNADANTLAAHVSDGVSGLTTVVTKSGTGAWSLTGNNSYSGGTTLSGGVLAIAANGNLGTASGAVSFAGGTLRPTASFTATRSTSLGTGGGTFDTPADVTLTWNGAISGAAGNPLNKTGAGTLVLGGTNTYAGDTNVAVGVLRLGAASALSPNSILHVAPGATFDPAGFTPTFAALSGTGTIDTGTGALAVAPSGTNTFTGTLSGSGGLTMNGTGTLELGAANTFSGATTIAAGTVKLGAPGALPSGTPVNLSSGATLNLNGYAATLGRLEGAGHVALGSATLTVAQSQNSTYTGAISGTGGLAKSGAGTLALAGTHPFSGTTSIMGGRLQLNGSAPNSAFTLAGGTLTGNATVGLLSVASGGTLSPGNSPGTVNSGSATWAGGGTFTFEVNKGAGAVAGTNFDLLAVAGSLTINATGGNPFTIGLNTLDFTSGHAGVPATFSPTANYAFGFVTTTSGVNGFDPSKFSFNTAGVDSSLTGTWSIAQSGYNLNLVYTGSAIPEPSTYAAIFGAVALVGAGWHRRRTRRALPRSP